MTLAAGHNGSTAGDPTGGAGGVGSGRPVYSASDVTMRYGNTEALSEVDFECHTGRVHALVGANGAGKSTLVKILAGVQSATSGRLALDGEEVEFANGRQAAKAGIAIVSQELNLFPDLTVQENLFLTREPRHGRTIVDGAEMRIRARPVLERIGLPSSVLTRPLRSLSLGARQLVEIARALLESPRVLILDEPTSALKASETRRLLDVIRELRKQDVAIIFVTHFLEDMFEIADEVTVLRSGKLIERSTPLFGLTPEKVINGMLGVAVDPEARRKISERSFPIPRATSEVGPLELIEAESRGALLPLTLKADPGEVVGLAGLEGSGASETLRLLFGDLKLTGGKVRLPSGRRAPRNKLAAVRAGVAYVPADRKANGLILQNPIYDNISMVTAGPLRRLGLFPRRQTREDRVEAWRGPLALQMHSPRAPVDLLSGGNQQKVVFAKWLETSPTLVLLDDPTRGVDVGAKADMINIIRTVAESGRVVLYASTDLDEMAKVCDRVVIFYRGGVVGELSSDFNEEKLLDSVTRGRVEAPGDGQIAS